MGQFFTDFSEYALNTTPTDWPNRWSTASYGTATVAASQGDTHAFVFTPGSGNGRAFRSWNAVDNTPGHSIIEAATEAAADAVTAQYNAIRIWAAGDATSTTGQAYFLEFSTNIDGAGTDGIRLGKFIIGSSSSVTLGGVAWALPANTIVQMKLRVENQPTGNAGARQVALAFKVWSGAITAEPTAWNTFTDTTNLVDVGAWTGVGLFTPTATKTFLNFRVGTNGDPAPTSAAAAFSATAAGTLPKLTASSSSTVTAPPAFTATTTGTLPKLTGTSQASAITTAVANLVPDGGTAPAGFTVFGAANAGLALSSNDGDTSYVENSGKTTGSFFVTLSDPPADFVKAISANLKVTLRRV